MPRTVTRCPRSNRRSRVAETELRLSFQICQKSQRRSTAHQNVSGMFLAALNQFFKTHALGNSPHQIFWYRAWGSVKVGRERGKSYCERRAPRSCFTAHPHKICWNVHPVSTMRVRLFFMCDPCDSNNFGLLQPTRDQMEGDQKCNQNWLCSLWTQRADQYCSQTAPIYFKTKKCEKRQKRIG